MTEIIVNKAGGTSNATPEAVAMSMEWANDALVTVVSAPGKLSSKEAEDFPIPTHVGPEIIGQKVTDILKLGYERHRSEGVFPAHYAGAVAGRYQHIVDGIGSPLNFAWLDNIHTRIQAASDTGWGQTSILGEQLMAEVYSSVGFKQLTPRQADNLGANHDSWRNAFGNLVRQPWEKYVIPGNTTTVNGLTTDFDRGGSDITGGLMSYAVNADLHRNLTDGGARSADPKLIGENAQPIEHLTYIEGRELGLSGTGLVHPAAMVPLMLGDIPTEIRSTFDRNAPYTLMDNDYERAEDRIGKGVALSLMKDVVSITVHEPGMAEAHGRIAEFSDQLGEQGINLIDALSGGFDWHTFVVDGDNADEAAELLAEAAGPRRDVERTDPTSIITLVGYELGKRTIDNLIGLSFVASLEPKEWQQEYRLTPHRHSLRIETAPDKAKVVLEEVHDKLIARHHEQ